MSIKPVFGRGNILGVGVSTLDIEGAIKSIDYSISTKENTYICVAPAHSLMEAYHDPDFQRILNVSGLTTPDGMSLVWVLRLLGYKGVDRVYGPELMLSVCKYGAKKKYRHFFYGGKPDVARALASRLANNIDDLRIVGTHSPPFRMPSDAEDHAEIDKINSTNPDVVWVGLSSPKQEFWMASHLGKINAPVMVGVGAAFDFLSGSKPQAPRWIQRSGFEWLFRLATEPKRLWPRYRQYPKFVLLLLLQLLGLKEFPIE